MPPFYFSDPTCCDFFFFFKKKPKKDMNYIYFHSRCFSFSLGCCRVISTEPCIITGHLGTVGRDEPAARHVTKAPQNTHPVSHTHTHLHAVAPLSSCKLSLGRSATVTAFMTRSRTKTAGKKKKKSRDHTAKNGRAAHLKSDHTSVTALRGDVSLTGCCTLIERRYVREKQCRYEMI